MKKILIFVLSTVLFASTLFTGCSESKKMGLDPKNAVTLTMWHNFGGEMQKTIDQLIDIFNATVGQEKGIIINVTAISSSSDLREKLNMIANGDPGAPELPDIFSCYPRTAIAFQEKDLIVDLDDYFSKKELSEYVPEFIEEGRFADGSLFVFPIAKSTEVLYVNQTFFDRFAAENDVSMDGFKTFEGIVDMANKYYKWTDSMTPEIENDGKNFFTADSWINVAQSGMKQLGEELFVNEDISLNNPEYTKIWDTLYPGFIDGGFALYDGYSSDLAKIGDLVCSTGSSAGILFYGDTITYPDNTTEKVEYSILPYPTFSGGEKYSIQRGNGLCISKSDKTREYAAACFLKWFTDSKQNLQFIYSTGYLPVKKDAFGSRMEEQINQIESLKIKKMLTTVTEMYKDYTFFTPPTFENFDALSKNYETNYKQILGIYRKEQLESEVEFTDCLKRFIALN